MCSSASALSFRIQFRSPDDIDLSLMAGYDGGMTLQGDTGSTRAYCCRHGRVACSVSARSALSDNPLYSCTAFRQYRERQSSKVDEGLQKDIWHQPEVENAFLDAILLVPPTARRKSLIRGKLYGRNMLIREYILAACDARARTSKSVESLGHKQVSSHVQVVKRFFENSRYFHFLFSSREEEESSRAGSDNSAGDERPSLETNPVVTALVEGRVPDVEPNYDYYAKIVSLQSSIVLRPKAWETIVLSCEGQSKRDHDASSVLLQHGSFPHQNEHSGCVAYGGSPARQEREVLLHEYTQSLSQTTSTCVKVVTDRWRKDTPAIYKTVNLPCRDEDCMLFEMRASIEPLAHATCPTGPELVGYLEVAVTQPNLQNHRWKHITRLYGPMELSCDENNSRGVHTEQGDVQCQHQSGANILVPFPVAEWVNILTAIAETPLRERRRVMRRQRRSTLTETRAGETRQRNQGVRSITWSELLEANAPRLIEQVAMHQELWSCAPDSTRWARQAIIFWHFTTTSNWHGWQQEKPLFRLAGAAWRWLTVSDPSSEQHQSNALVKRSIAAPAWPAETAMTVAQAAKRHVSADLQELSWENSTSLTTARPLHTWNSRGLEGFRSFADRPLTPPPMAFTPNGSYCLGSASDTTTDIAGFDIHPAVHGTANSQPPSAFTSHEPDSTETWPYEEFDLFTTPEMASEIACATVLQDLPDQQAYDRRNWFAVNAGQAHRSTPSSAFYNSGKVTEHERPCVAAQSAQRAPGMAPSLTADRNVTSTNLAVGGRDWLYCGDYIHKPRPCSDFRRIVESDENP